MTAWQKAVKYLAVAFAIFLIVSIIGGICGMFATFSYIFGDKSAAGEMQSYSVSGNIDSLKIEIGATKFTIENSDEFRVESNHKHLTVKEENNCLIIKEKEKLFRTDADNLYLNLYIPKNITFKEVNFSAGAGTVTIDSLSAQDLKLELGAGKADIERLEALQSAKIDGGAGKLTVNGGLLSDLDINMGVGKLYLVSRVEGKSKIDQGVGSGEIVLLGKADDYAIDVEKGISAVKIDGNKIDSDTVFGTGENKIEIDSGVGSLDISFKSEN